MGLYPAPPARRMPWDRDGSALVNVTSASVLTTRSAAERQTVNDETNSALGSIFNSGAKVAVVFAVPQTVVGVFVATATTVSGPSWTIEYSLDTTTGNDGAWSTFRAAGSYGQSQDVPDRYRALVSAGDTHGIYVPGSPVASVKGIRFRCVTVTGSANVAAMHVYGYPTAASNRLMLWHPTLNQALSDTPAIYDLGDVPRGAGPQVLSFRVKNISGTLTAQGVSVLREALTDGSPTIVSLTQLRYNAGAYGNTATIGNIAPGAISNIVDAAIDVTALAPVGLWAPRIIAAATSWA